MCFYPFIEYFTYSIFLMILGDIRAIIKWFCGLFGLILNNISQFFFKSSKFEFCTQLTLRMIYLLLGLPNGLSCHYSMT